MVVHGIQERGLGMKLQCHNAGSCTFLCRRKGLLDVGLEQGYLDWRWFQWCYPYVWEWNGACLSNLSPFESKLKGMQKKRVEAKRLGNSEM